jgi:hypothetical protein
LLWRGAADFVALKKTGVVILDGLRVNEARASPDCMIAFIGGDSAGERYVEWSFVSSNKKLVEKAKVDGIMGSFRRFRVTNMSSFP